MSQPSGTERPAACLWATRRRRLSRSRERGLIWCNVIRCAISITARENSQPHICVNVSISQSYICANASISQSHIYVNASIIQSHICVSASISQSHICVNASVVQSHICVNASIVQSHICVNASGDSFNHKHLDTNIWASKPFMAKGRTRCCAQVCWLQVER